MFEQFTNSEERGQVGIGTLIVFIALVLVAAIAAGVVFYTAGFLLTQGHATGEESTEQVSTNLVFLSTTGTVTDDPEDGIDRIETTVQLGPGSSAIDLDDATVSVFTDDGESVEFDGVNSDGDSDTDAIAILTDPSEDDGESVLSTDASDDDATATIVFNLDGGAVDGSEFGADVFEPGTSIDVVITTAEGTQAENTFSIENPLDTQVGDEDEIRLG